VTVQPLRIFVGWEPREALAYHVFAHSILRRASIPVAITPIMQGQLRGNDLYWREKDAHAATEFSLTRFLVPALADYRGLAIFADCDMLMQADIAELVEIAEEQRLLHGDGPAVLVAKHDYVPKSAIKMDGQVQTAYPMKNWSSFMVMDAAKCRMLTPRYVNAATPADLHRFVWLGDHRHELVGDLPLDWNWLVSEYLENPSAKNLHYTLGGPWFGEPDAWQGDHAPAWIDEHLHMLRQVSQGAA
jgi:hypothetical protein